MGNYLFSPGAQQSCAGKGGGKPSYFSIISHIFPNLYAENLYIILKIPLNLPNEGMLMVLQEGWNIEGRFMLAETETKIKSKEVVGSSPCQFIVSKRGWEY